MKKILATLSALITIGAYGETETIHWYMDGQIYATTQCETGDDINLPQTPYKYGYTFNGWFEYIPIEYLESTGTQWIDTGVVANQGTEAEIEFKDVVGSSILFMTTTGSWNSKNFGINMGGSAGYLLFYMNCDGYTNYAITLDTKVSGNVKLLRSGIYFNDDKLSVTRGKIPSSVNFTTTYTIPIFAYKTNGSVVGMYKYKLKFFKLWQDSVLVRDFIPVLDKDGTPCLYDKVERKFYYNAGTGDFIAGPVIDSGGAE